VADWYKAQSGAPPEVCFEDDDLPHFQPDARSELRWCLGCGVERWAMTPGPTPTPGGGGAVSAWEASCSPATGQSGCYFSACAERRDDPDRAVFVITDALGNPDLETADDYQPHLTAAIGIIRAQYPSLRQIVLMTVIGGPDHATCYCSSASQCSSVPATPVRASANHPIIDAAIAQWIANHPEQPDVVQGPSPEVDDCRQFADATGHLTTAAACPLAGKIAALFEPPLPACPPQP
jgi:hypothetical protein